MQTGKVNIRLKYFFQTKVIENIEIVEGDSTVSYDLNCKSPVPATLKEVYDTYKEKWEQLNWHIEYEDDFIGLYAKRKNGTH